MSFNFNSIVTALQASGLTPSQVVTATQNLAGGNKITNYLNVIMANSNNPEVIKDEVIKIQELPGLSASVAGLLPALTAPGVTAAQVVQTVLTIEQMTASQSSILPFGL
jgi:hypothetical protein